MYPLCIVGWGSQCDALPCVALRRATTRRNVTKRYATQRPNGAVSTYDIPSTGIPVSTNATRRNARQPKHARRIVNRL